MEAPTTQELEILPKFRQRLQDLKLDGLYNTDIFLLKWLRAREMNLNQSEDMLRKSLKWRQEDRIDSILSWKASDFLLENYPLEISGYDNNNSPIASLSFGKWDLKKMISHGHKADYIRYIDQLFERILDKMEGKLTIENIPVTQFIIIFDMDGLAMTTLASKAAIEAILENLRRFEANYPETLKSAFVINASRVFTLLFAIVRPILSQRTFGKVQVFNNNASKWQKALFDTIPRDQLSRVFGGTSNLNLNSHLENGHENQNENELRSATISIGSGTILPIAFQVDAKGTLMKWSFTTENYDIGYNIVLDSNGKVLDPGQRVESTSEWFQGQLTCNETGVYIFNFDNSFSRFRSKVVKYKIQLLKPQV